MILSENRWPLFGIMLYPVAATLSRVRLQRRAGWPKHVACDTVYTVERERRFLARTSGLGEGTARMEAAPARRIDRARHIALQHDPFALAGHVRNRGQQRARTRRAAF